MQNVMAIVLDCDDTICDDSTTFILRRYGIEPSSFWQEVGHSVSRGWDPTLAYIRRIIEMAEEGKMRGLNNKKLRELGSELTFYPGVPAVFGELKEMVNETFSSSNVSLEFYLITGGIEEVIRGSAIAPYMTDIIGCTLHEDPRIGVSFPRSIVTFTERTKYLFAISKGIPTEVLRQHPYEVNTVVPSSKRRIPFENMIYIGDKPSDIPCFSLVKANGGHVIGVFRRNQLPGMKQFEFAKGQRMTIGPFLPDYRKGTDIRTFLNALIQQIGLRIVTQTHAGVQEAVQ